ncbi:ABC transporter permease [Bailinhaonella thermotolerans]|uniref:Transport permease protein n=1 Tax=Bailinhaonella thermotolerans TaxID=1070861 RepID=A0A3A4AY32_9ACTN|nr:ABC transporter permease [Bailinhaonella thermotolerans]RJL32406.1 ABC transporter permease [Bailinhaonella thermotolerans]
MIKDVRLLFAHEVRGSLRNPFWLLFGVVQPVLWLVLFAPLLDGLMPGGSALRDFTPGALVLIALSSGLSVGYGMLARLRAGVLERLAAGPVSRAALVLAPALRDMVVLVGQAALLLGLAALMGMRANPLGVALTLVLVAALGLLSATLSYALALTARDENGLAQLNATLYVPMLLLTGIILPMALAPGWLQAIAAANPLYHAVEAGRALFAGDFRDGSIPLALALTTGLALLTLRWAITSVRRLAA